MRAEAAALTGDGVNLVILNGFKAAKLLA